MKVRCREGYLQSVVFAARKKIENGGGGPEALRWATEARSPEAGRRKGQVHAAVLQVQSAMPEIDGGGGGEVWSEVRRRRQRLEGEVGLERVRKATSSWDGFMNKHKAAPTGRA